MSKNNLIIVGLVIALSAVGVYAIQITKNADDGDSSVVDVKEGDDNQPVDKDIEKILKDAELHEVGSTVEYATRSINVQKAESKKSFTSYGQSYVAEPGTKYLVVTFTETNISSEPFRSESYTLLGDNGMVYAGNTGPESYAEGSLVGQMLNPGVPKTGTNTFTIPEDLESVNIGSTNANTGKFVGVKLTF